MRIRIQGFEIHEDPDPVLDFSYFVLNFCVFYMKKTLDSDPWTPENVDLKPWSLWSRSTRTQNFLPDPDLKCPQNSGLDTDS